MNDVEAYFIDKLKKTLDVSDVSFKAWYVRFTTILFKLQSE